MSVWDTYRNRMEPHGTTIREVAKIQESRMLLNKMQENLSYFTITVYDQAHGYNIMDEPNKCGAYQQNVAIINSDNLNEKYIYSLPGEDIEHGCLIWWMDNYWLVTERDANSNVYVRGKMIQCNYLLKWVSDNKIYEQWCIVEDGTKYLTGEYEDRNFVVTRGDSRIYLTIAKNEITSKLGRKNRFLIDDPESEIMMSYLLTKPLKLGGTFNHKGVFKFVLQEVNSTADDNMELCIADYYKYFPKEDGGNDDDGNTGTGAQHGDGNGGASAEDDGGTSGGKKVWL